MRIVRAPTTMTASNDSFHNLDDFVPSLRQAMEKQPLDLTKVIRVAVPMAGAEDEEPRVPEMIDRTCLFLTAGGEVCPWETDSLRALFRSDRQPPVLGDHPQAYEESFITFDLHALEISQIIGDRRDEEMREIYSALRRRPDGRSLGFVHDYMWQAAALVLGTQPLSQAEFEAILARLERSCRTFAQGVTSRNYIGALRQTFDEGESTAD